MMATESTGTANPVVGGAEVELAAPTANKTRVLMVDLNALQNGDTVVLRIKMPMVAGGPIRQYIPASFAGAQADPGIVSIPVPSIYGATFTLQQTGGTSRAFPWSVVTLD